ncbi:MAG: hypothetical protein KatS3mg110_3302 [Pirellulaceae bacterium]|nr:MAG: hypothetical protein KatS3mg110_3302 [Pirellulaceae bacterium]
MTLPENPEPLVTNTSAASPGPPSLQRLSRWEIIRFCAADVIRGWWRVLIGALVLGGLLIAVIRPWQESSLGWWTPTEALLSLLTLAVAVLIWLGELREEWERNLPKRLEVVYFFEGRPVMVCRDCMLVSESDIRAWAQQLGAQLCQQPVLQFVPEMLLVPPRLVFHRPLKKVVRLYKLGVELVNLPEKLAERRRQEVSHLPNAVLVRTVYPVLKDEWLQGFEVEPEFRQRFVKP